MLLQSYEHANKYQNIVLTCWNFLFFNFTVKSIFHKCFWSLNTCNTIIYLMHIYFWFCNELQFRWTKLLFLNIFRIVRSKFKSYTIIVLWWICLWILFIVWFDVIIPREANYFLCNKIAVNLNFILWVIRCSKSIKKYWNL